MESDDRSLGALTLEQNFARDGMKPAAAARRAQESRGEHQPASDGRNAANPQRSAHGGPVLVEAARRAGSSPRNLQTGRKEISRRRERSDCDRTRNLAR